MSFTGRRLWASCSMEWMPGRCPILAITKRILVTVRQRTWFNVIRLFNVYYPVRTLILLVGEALVVWVSLLIGTVLCYREDSYLVLNFEYGYYKIFIVTTVVLLCSHWFDLYKLTNFDARGG